jgi:hypothetical protein
MQSEFILGCILGIIIGIFLYLFIRKCRVKKECDKFDKLPFIFYMHGKRFTPEEAIEYYDIQKLRNHDPYLMIYDTTTKEYVFKGSYSYYEEGWVTLRDNLYHE